MHTKKKARHFKMKFKLPKRCEYCAHKLVDGKCVNPDCIAYVKPETTSTTTTTEDGVSK